MNTIKTTVLLSALTLILVWAGGAMGGQGGAVFAFAIAIVMNFGSYWFSDKIILSMYKAKEVTESEQPEFHSMMRELSERANLPMPKVYVIPQDAPNAFATGRNPEHAAVAATTGILSLLTREELMGVMAHELAHVKNRDILIGSIAATIAGAISMLANMAQWAMIFGGGRSRDENGPHPAVMIATMIIAPIAAMIVQMAISRSREYGADSEGARICGRPEYLASALNKLENVSKKIPMQVNESTKEATAHMFIVNPLTGGGLMSLFSTHPPIAERVKRLRGMNL
ncbi:MAG: zinc metalloprotease HtpX [bacterium]|nr:zinc metalloprotease HtpX [bacterium]